MAGDYEDYRSRSSGRVQSVGSKFHPVEIHLILRSVLVTAQSNLGKRLVCEHPSLDILGHAVRGSEVIAVDFHIYRSGTAHTAHTLGHGSFMDFRIFPDIGTDNVGDFTCRTLTKLHTSEVDVH